MVSCAGELFRRGAAGEIIRTKMQVISMIVQSQGELLAAGTILVPAYVSPSLVRLRLHLVAGWRKQISAAPDGADDGRLGRVRLDFAPDSHDPQVHGAIESLAVAGVGQLQQPLARQ